MPFVKRKVNVYHLVSHFIKKPWTRPLERGEKFQLKSPRSKLHLVIKWNKSKTHFINR